MDAYRVDFVLPDASAQQQTLDFDYTHMDKHKDCGIKNGVRKNITRNLANS